MFKKVVFILESNTAIDAAENIVNNLSMCGVTVQVISRPLRNYTDDETWFVLELNENKLKENIEQNILYITDIPYCHKYLQDNSLPVIAYMHENNKNKSFSYAEYAIEQIEEIEYESLKLAYQRLAGEPWSILETDRCLIRETTVDDVDSFYEIYKEPSITQYMENLYSERDAEIAYIQDYIKNVYAFYGYGMWTVLDKKENQVIGRAGINWREGYDIPELGFVIAVPFQRKGYAFEICQAIIKYGVKELGFTSFQVLIMKDNIKSKLLCEKLGFEHAEKVTIDKIPYERMILQTKPKI